MSKPTGSKKRIHNTMEGFVGAVSKDKAKKKAQKQARKITRRTRKGQH